MDMSEKTRKRGRDDDPAEEEQEDNGKKLVKEGELERTGPLALPIKYKPRGGLNVININCKLKALRLKHLGDIINSRQVKFVKFSIYWVGFTLRFYSDEFRSLNIPHSEYISPFYQQCIDVYTEFKVVCDSNDIRGVTTKEKQTKDVEFTPVFKNVFDKFMDRFSRDVIFKIVHGILPTNSLLFNHNVYKSNRCTFCAREPETLKHLFL
ncbi:unnamed protein product [Mytilus edulis]|uniref:Uncharacterized protein n=1 Tax=Mytilus edulis TaxID=6550 RepID=A0A8S3UG61_MYTED|nr:unnamed protein product [Mytilus edulis]